MNMAPESVDCGGVFVIGGFATMPGNIQYVMCFALRVLASLTSHSVQTSRLPTARGGFFNASVAAQIYGRVFCSRIRTFVLAVRGSGRRGGCQKQVGGDDEGERRGEKGEEGILHRALNPEDLQDQVRKGHGVLDVTTVLDMRI